MKKIIVACLVLLPELLMAGTDCTIKEFPDHYLVECIGDEIAKPVSSVSSALAKPAAASVQASTNAQPDSSNQSGATTYSNITAGSTENRVNVPPNTAVQGQKEDTLAAKPALSRKNTARIEAQQMKELKRRAQAEVM